MVSLPAQAGSNDRFDKAAYAEAIGKVREGDLTVDLKWLRQQNAIQSGYGASRWSEEEQASKAVADAPETALKLARARIESNFGDIFAHAVAETALGRLGREQEAQAEHALIVALLSTVTEGRDGQSREQAWNAVSVDEEYAALLLLGFLPGSQAQANEGGHAFDVVTVTDRDTGEETSIWFNIDFFHGKGLS